jgi:glycosyltransferase involved in cell wall biosynthesis
LARIAAGVAGAFLKILFLSAWFPTPPDNGSKIRVHNLLRTLAARHEISLLTFAPRGEPLALDALKEICAEVECVPWKPFDAARARRGFFSSTPRSLVDTYSPAMAELVRARAARKSYDVVIASTIEMARYAWQAPSARVLEEHNCATRLMREQYAAETQPLKRARHWLTWRKYAQYESRLYQQFDVCAMVSEEDARAARELAPATPIVVIPNGVNLRDYTRDDIIAAADDTLIFNGALTYAANLDGVRFFVAEIFPLIRAQLPHARLKITGRYDGIALDGIGTASGVELTGYLDDVRPAVRESAVCVVPLQRGGGTRLKILEAMAVGTPVVSTSKGAEGLAVTHGENILIADDPRVFADYACELVRQPERRKMLAANARRLVEEHYDWQRIGEEFESVLARAVEARRA